MITAEGDGVIEYVDSYNDCILYDRTEEEEFVSSNQFLRISYSLSSVVLTRI